MMIAHPAEYAKMVDLASKATGADKEVADEVVANMRYGLIPEGPARRAVVFGGSNIHVLKPEYVDGGLDEMAVKALICMWTSPEWSTKLNWVGSNPGNLRGFKTKWMKERLDTIKFLDVTTSMLPNGIPFPVIPEAPEIMNIIVPDMLQNALTEKMTVDEAAEDAAAKVKEAARRHVAGARLDDRQHSCCRSLRRASERDVAREHRDGRQRRRLRRHAPPRRAGLLQRIVNHRADYLYVLPALMVMLSSSPTRSTTRSSSASSKRPPTCR